MVVWKACGSREPAIPIQSDIHFAFAIDDESFDVVVFILQEGLSEAFVLHVGVMRTAP